MPGEAPLPFAQPAGSRRTSYDPFVTMLKFGFLTWMVQGDVDGDGVADLEIIVVTPDAHPITALDFIL